MFNIKRDDSIERLSDVLDKRRMRKVISQGYSDISLSYMASRIKSYAEQIVDNAYSVETLNKLTDALAHNKIDAGDFWHIMKYSQYSKDNEKYVDDYLDSIDKGIYHRCATDLLVALQYEDMTYNEGLAFVKTGAFYPTEYAAVSVTDKVAKELADMGVNLRGCKGFNHYYEVDDISSSLEDHDAIFVADRELAVKVGEYMEKPDWRKFKESAIYTMGRDIKNLTGKILDELHTDFVRSANLELLYNKIHSEYEGFINSLKSKSAEEIIKSAYEIVTKENFMSYCEDGEPDLTEKQINALLSRNNVLDEIYQDWCYGETYSSISDVPDAFKDTANKIQISIERQVQERIKQPEQKQDALQKKSKSL